MNNSGLFLVDKPIGLTSHQVVNVCRRLFGTKKVGHSGTLDPLATGLLLIAVGRATKILQFMNLDRKTYEAEIGLGITTNTDDITGEEINIYPDKFNKLNSLTEQEIVAAVYSFRGDILQVPSKVSAKKIKGKKAYDLERQGIDFELKPVPINIGHIEVIDIARTDTGIIKLKLVIECSSGTYIRAIARDLGEKLQVGGCVTILNRTKVGNFILENAASLDSLKENPELTFDIDTLVEVLFPKIILNEAEALDIQNGRLISSKLPGKRYGVFSPAGKAIAILNEFSSTVKIDYVIFPANLLTS